MCNKTRHVFGLVIVLSLLSGCASFSRGVTEAILDRNTEDTRQCWINGREFDGMDRLFERADGSDIARLKILKVHGIGTHTPGYSQRLQNGLIENFGFTAMDETVKTISMIHANYDGNLGTLRIHRYLDPERAREMLFYELTWDPIVEQEKKLLDFDNTAESSARRVPFNHTLKVFSNATLPDALMYNSRFRQPIQLSIGQAICWMLSEKWENLPADGSASCAGKREDYVSKAHATGLAIISHSLGSRISIDALQTLVSQVSKLPNYREISASAQASAVYLYMLSNQLPLLQVGQPLPEIHDQVESYCREDGERYDERFLQQLQVVAFSDPNDLFSYAVTPGYINRHVDSRLCPSVTNVSIQVAPITSILGLQEVANPETAHTEYETDSRVLKMLVSGFGKTHGHADVKQRCEFIEALPSQ
ncbi:MAG: hypothetical protein QNJ85_04585 [Gammaproteobacteria bacterium]|nr:hypothetical protein [Gammaproteobacteria bacterium]